MFGEQLHILVAEEQRKDMQRDVENWRLAKSVKGPSRMIENLRHLLNRD